MSLVTQLELALKEGRGLLKQSSSYIMIHGFINVDCGIFFRMQITFIYIILAFHYIEF